jgi:hypothetical protein
MRHYGRYVPLLSHPIFDAIAALQEGNIINQGGVVEACEAAASQIQSPEELGWLYADLICALNGSDWLPFVSGVLNSRLTARLP